MKFNPKKIARLIAIIYLAFFLLLSFDSKSVIEFLVHNIPTAIFAGILILSRYKPKLGGIIFSTLGIITIFFFKTYENIFSILTISLIPIGIGIAYYFSKK